MKEANLIGAALSILIFATGTSLADQTDPRLDGLFETLQSGELHLNETGPLQNSIWQIWTETGDVKGDTLMRDGMIAMRNGDLDSAITIFSRLIDHMPNVAEAWNKRATVFYLANRMEESIADVKQTLALEPRHFGAMSGLGMIYDQLEQTEAAITAFEETLKVNPYLPRVQLRLQQLKEKLEEERI